MATAAPIAFSRSPTSYEADYSDLDVCKSPSSPPVIQLSGNVACRADHFSCSSTIERSTGAASPRRPDVEVSTKYLFDDDCVPMNLMSSGACDVISVIPEVDDSSRREATGTGPVRKIRPSHDVHEKLSGALNGELGSGNNIGRRFKACSTWPHKDDINLWCQISRKINSMFHNCFKQSRWSEIHAYMHTILIVIDNNNNNRLYSTPGTPQAGLQRHHTGMRGAGMASVGCQPQGPACRQPTANTAPVVHLSQPKLVPT